MQPRNILWIFGDQHRAQAMGYAGDANARTPNFDAFAAQGVNFQRAISQCPWCAPFRGSLLTGLPAHRCVRRTPQRIDPAIPTAAHHFNAAGYDTAYFGKWHLARNAGEPVPVVEGRPRHDHFPVPREWRGGFGTWLGFESGMVTTDVSVHGHTPHGEEPLRTLPGFETDALTDLFIADLERRRDAGRPFFSVLSVKPPHNPYVAPHEWMKRFDPARMELRPNVPSGAEIRERTRKDLAGYHALIANWDFNFGRIMAALRTNGLLQNTVVCLFSDHGDMHGSHGFRDKSTPWEESIRIPFLVGGAVPEAARATATDALLCTVDILPTTLGLGGLGEVARGLPGFDYSQRVLGGGDGGRSKEPDAVLIQHVEPKLHPGTFDCTWRGIVTRDGWKYFCTEHTAIGLYHLAADPYEEVNLLHRHPFRDKERELRARLEALLDEAADSYPLPPCP